MSIKLNILQALEQEVLLFDGGFGTMLQAGSMPPGFKPERYNLSDPERIIGIHRRYIAAGARVVTTNTFGANELNFGPDADDVIRAGVACAREAGGDDVYVALDIGPLAELTRTAADFDRACEIFARVVRAGKDADFILIETMTDIFQAKAAVLAAKENSGKPVFCSMTLEGTGRTMTGSGPDIIAAVLEGLGVDALGLNCGYGAAGYAGPVARLLERAHVPVFAQPNAGLPRVENGKTVFSEGPGIFSESLVRLAKMGLSAVGGCCGTTPEHIAALRACLDGLKPARPSVPDVTVACSYGQLVEFGGAPVVIGERLNPNGKKAVAKALRESDWDSLTGEAFKQIGAGAHVLDVNAGLPDIDEAAALDAVVGCLQRALPVPLQIDSTNPAALERVLRHYNGKAILNSVCGKAESLDKLLPIAAKYGAVVIGLTLDENGIPESAEERVAIARRISDRAREFGIAGRDILIDTLTLTAGAQQSGIRHTLQALEDVKALGLKTVLGVSNVSFGLPRRELLNSAFLTMALCRGLDACIINPGSGPMREALLAAGALLGTDAGCMRYIEAAGAAAAEAPDAVRAANKTAAPTAAAAAGKTAGVPQTELPDSGLRSSIEKGLAQAAQRCAEELLADGAGPAGIIEEHIVPALNAVGVRYESGKVFLPQLMQAAKAAESAFAVLERYYEQTGARTAGRGRIMLATVHGDVHDIGKNIVRTMLVNFGFEVTDLGRDVPPETIVEAVLDGGIRLLGLSALMTTTVGAMERTIELVREAKPDCRIMVGGAVLNEEYARKIGADGYAPDAMSAVRLAGELLG